MYRRKWLFCILAFVLLIALTGCPPRQQPAPQPGDAVDLDISTLTQQWVDSGHANISIYAAGREGCVICHDGGAYADQISNPADLERDFFVAIDCRACHTGRGQELLESGVVDIPTQENVRAGAGAQCLDCHNERRAPNIADENRSAPHPSSQAGVFTATGGLRVEGFEYGSTAAHVNIENTCNGCHMLETEQGFLSHTFQVDDVEAACQRCHQNITDMNLEANNDYDGDGTVKGFMDEVLGLLELVEGAIGEELEGGTFEVGGGRIQFKDADGNDMQVSDEVYLATYNYVLVVQDGSLGLHNPLFVVQLLQQSYRALIGEDVPGATIR